MGFSSTRAFDFTSYASTAATYSKAATPAAAFKARALDPYLDPSKFMLRESRNSVANPKSTPVILGVDVTGSMGMIAHEIVKTGLGKLITEIIERNPVSDPHIMFQAIGDVDYDRSPFQVSQFETDIKIVDQLEKIHVEGGGGGNASESYNVPWHFAAYHTSCDAFEKDGRKGFIFTMGDENVPRNLTEGNLLAIYGRTQEPNATNEQLLEMLSSKYHVFHLMIEQGNHMRYDRAGVVSSWNKLLGQRAISVADHTKIAEIVISTMQIVNGVDKATVVDSWSKETALVVKQAVSGLTVDSVAKGGLVRF